MHCLARLNMGTHCCCLCTIFILHPAKFNNWIALSNMGLDDRIRLIIPAGVEGEHILVKHTLEQPDGGTLLILLQKP